MYIIIAYVFIALSVLVLARKTVQLEKFLCIYVNICALIFQKNFNWETRIIIASRSYYTDKDAA